MKYSFSCYECCNITSVDSRPFVVPEAPFCPKCKTIMDRVYGCQINTSGCHDADYVPESKRVYDERSRLSAEAKERAFHRHIKERRALVAEAGHSKSIRMTHSVPADLYHGKIRETGDKKYWDDPSNLKRHSSCKVE